MARPKKSEVSDTVVSEVPVTNEHVDAPESTESEEVVKFPEVRGTGKFQAVKVKGGFVIYNPDGVRVSGIVNDKQADDIVRAQNIAAHLK